MTTSKWDDLLAEALSYAHDAEDTPEHTRLMLRFLARRCARAEADLARLVEASLGVQYAFGSISRASVDAFDNLRCTLRSIDEKRDNPKETT